MPLKQPRRAGMSLETGQTTQYSSEEDDGYHEKGLGKRYSVLTTGQHSGACSFDLDGKTETQSHNCVQDLVTGKMWARYGSGESASVGPGSDGKMPWTGAADDIFQYVAAANTAELGGYTDWRVPNIAEALSLLDYSTDPAIPNTVAFPGWPEGNFWTATTSAQNTLKAWIVMNSIPRWTHDTKTNAHLLFNLIRGGL